MSVEDAVMENLRQLPVDKQQEVLDFVRFLRQQSPSVSPRQPLKGMWSRVHITEDDIADVRREMWSRFPREEAL
jgi:hypothetical protein